MHLAQPIGTSCTADSHSRCHHRFAVVLQEQFINDRDFLLSAVEAVGLPREAAADIIDNANSVGEKLVQQELGKYAGITGVPHFIINGR